MRRPLVAGLLLATAFFGALALWALNTDELTIRREHVAGGLRWRD